MFRTLFTFFPFRKYMKSFFVLFCVAYQTKKLKVALFVFSFFFFQKEIWEHFCGSFFFLCYQFIECIC